MGACHIGVDISCFQANGG